MRLLYLSYYFPPMTGPGALRALKHSKYLADSNIYSLILAALDKDYARDEFLLEQIAECTNVVRIPFSAPIASVIRVKNWLLNQNTRGNAVGARIDGPIQIGNLWIRDEGLKLLNSAFFPDDKRRWGVRAFREAILLSKIQPFDIILSSSPPVSSHWTAYRLARQLGLPWVAEFRDLWVGGAGYNSYLPRRIIDQCVERRWLQKANALIGVTEGFSKYLGGAIGDPKKVTTIRNGFDEEDFVRAERCDSSAARECFEFRFMGTLYRNTSPGPLLRVIPSFFEKFPEFKGKVRFRFVGRVGERFLGPFSEIRSEFPGSIILEKSVSHSDSIKLMLEADALMLFIGGGVKAESIVPCKLYEYIRAKRPILLFGPEGGEADLLLQSVGLGRAISDDCLDSAVNALRAIVDGDWVSQSPNEELIAQYSREAAATKLGQLLLDVHSQFKVQRT